jgi:hypothetical protein
MVPENSELSGKFLRKKKEVQQDKEDCKMKKFHNLCSPPNVIRMNP